MEPKLIISCYVCAGVFLVCSQWATVKYVTACSAVTDTIVCSASPIYLLFISFTLQRECLHPVDYYQLLSPFL